jgi:hypothetical protein
MVLGFLLLTIHLGECPIKPSTDIHTVCDFSKYRFSVQPDPVSPPLPCVQVFETMSKSSQLYHSPSVSLKLEDFDVRLDKIRNIVQSLPPAHFDLLKRVAELLDRY